MNYKIDLNTLEKGSLCFNKILTPGTLDWERAVSALKKYSNNLIITVDNPEFFYGYLKWSFVYENGIKGFVKIRKKDLQEIDDVTVEKIVFENNVSNYFYQTKFKI